GRAARHRAGVPVLELAACDEHHRIVIVRALRRRDQVRGNELAAARGRREMRDEYDGLARVAFFLARISDGGLALEALPGDSRDRVHALAHLVEHFARMRVVPGKSHAPGELVDEPDRKSTRLNSSHLGISYAVFCLKKKKKNKMTND